MPFPGGTYLANIIGTENWVYRELDQHYALLQGWLGVEHDEDGHHTDITAESVTVEGDGVFGGDVVALDGSGTECAIGDLTTVSGTELVPGESIRNSGLLIGGVAHGHYLFNRTRASAFTGTGSLYQLSLYALDESTTAPILMIGTNSGVATILDGGTGSIGLALGSVARPTISIDVTTLTATTASGTKFIPTTLGITGRLAPAQITANVNDYAINGSGRVFLTSDAAHDITGIVAGFEGEALLLFNNSGFTLTLKNQSASSTPGNKFVGPTGGDYALRTFASVWVVYDTTTGSWWVLGA